MSDEVADLVSQLPSSKPQPDEDLFASDDEDDDDYDLDADEKAEAKAEAKPKAKTRRRTSRRKQVAPKEQTLEDLDADMLPSDLPKPAENVKTLGDIYAKYNIGDSPDFSIQVYRMYPKMAPGGRKIDGFYDEWQEPLTEQQLQAEYGGGTYRIVVMGPHPGKMNAKKHYESHRVQLAGDPKYERRPGALQGSSDSSKGANGTPAPAPNPPPLGSQENPKVVETAMKLMADTVTAEREERRRVEERATQRNSGGDEYVRHAIESERRRADDMTKAERERREEERRANTERVREEKAERERLRREMEAIKHSQPSISDTISALTGTGLFNRDSEGVAKEMLTQILERQRADVDAIHKQNQTFVESVRNGYESQIAAVREAQAREISSERESSRGREDRINERLEAERAERRRDQENFRKQVEDRDLQWKDRMESAKALMEQTWQSRHTSTIANLEQRIQWKDQEIDRLRTELSDAKSKQEEKGDVVTQLMQMKQMQDTLKDFAGAPQHSAGLGGAGGIGLNKGGDAPEWLSTVMESPVIERVAASLFGGGDGGAAPQAPAAPPQPQYQEGQEVSTPQGVMVVVRNPQNGQLAFAPKEALAAYNQAVQQQQGGGSGSSLLGPPPQKRRREAVPNLMKEYGFKAPKSPWDDDEDEPAAAPPKADRAAAPPSPPAALTKPAPKSAGDSEPLALNKTEKQVLSIIAKHVHEHVMSVSEPEEFVQELTSKYPASIIEQIVKGYTTEQIIRGVTQVEPRAAGATPAGRQFMLRAVKMLRDSVG